MCTVACTVPAGLWASQLPHWPIETRSHCTKGGYLCCLARCNFDPLPKITVAAVMSHIMSTIAKLSRHGYWACFEWDWSGIYARFYVSQVEVLSTWDIIPFQSLSNRSTPKRVLVATLPSSYYYSCFYETLSRKLACTNNLRHICE